MRWIAFALFLAPSVALAQAQPEYTLKLTQQQAIVIVQALGKQPYEIVQPVIDEIRTQFVVQEQARKDDKKPVDGK